MKHCQDVTILIGTSAANSAESVQIYSPYFGPGIFLRWEIENQLFEKRFHDEEDTFSEEETSENEEVAWEKIHFKCIYGIIRVLDRSYLIGITSVEQLKEIDIFRCNGLSWISLPFVGGTDSTLDMAFISRCESLLNEFCTREYRNVYGSFSTNLAKKMGEENNGDAMGFQWNADLHHQLGSKDYAVPLIYGHIEQHYTTDITFLLVNRRSRFHAGTRYHTRGFDENGYAAATVETEIIIHNKQNNTSASYVFLRGSFPGFWSQPLTGKFNPTVQHVKEKNGTKLNAACRKHFDRVEKYYSGTVTVLNLLSKRNIAPVQKYLKEMLSTDPFLSKNSPNIIDFDFHSYTSIFDFSGVNKLVESISQEVDQNGYSLLIYDGEDSSYQKTQRGVIRTNCVDCIDRTNFAQYLLCRYVVGQILREIEPSWTDPLDFLGPMWQRTGSALAHQYVGTHALYQDAYPELHRSSFSAIFDGCIALKRYYTNHLLDGRKQDRLTLSTRSDIIDSITYTEKIYDQGVEIHRILAGGILISLFFAWGNRYFEVALDADLDSESIFFSKLFSSVWGGVACLLLLSGVLLRKRLFSYPQFL
ncbi:SACM1L protein [Perkinsela sp. CCAP 1560/4]|nr:SACM1L protein [Perkinsela sp. CCAP 1560/4]|eukprot:KNH08611.1 SACM1L protein [Perkinsela sp. CCAP 1560/4]